MSGVNAILILLPIFQNVEIYNNLVITVKKLSIQLEEKLLWKMLGFLGWGGGGGSGGTVNDHEMELDDGKRIRRARAWLCVCIAMVWDC